MTDLDEVADKGERGIKGDAVAAAERQASFFVRQHGESSAAYAEKVFRWAFSLDIENTINMKVGGSLRPCKCQ